MNQAIQRPLQPSPFQDPTMATSKTPPAQQAVINHNTQAGIVDAGVQAASPNTQFEHYTSAASTEAPPMEPQGPAGQALWKPLSESDGNLVMLFPYVAGTVVIKDANTGEVLDTGRSTGPSNGYADTVRFSRPGSAYREVIVEDSLGNAIYIKDGSARIENIEVYGGANQPGAFPNLGASVTPTIPAFQPIEETPKPKRPKGPKLKLPASTFKAAPAPTTEREDAPSRSVKEFSQAFQKQRGR